MAEDISHQVEIERIEDRLPPSTDLVGFVRKNWRWLCVVALVAIGWRIDNWMTRAEHQKERNNFFVSDVTITPVDAATHQLIEHVSISYDGDIPPSCFPRVIFTNRNPKEYELIIAAISPVRIGLQADGYLETAVEIPRQREQDHRSAQETWRNQLITCPLPPATVQRRSLH